MFIDIHAHAYRHPVPFVCKFCSEQELLERYDRDGIEVGILMPIVNSEIYFPQANEEILEMVERHPTRLRAFCNVDPRCLSDDSHAPLDKVLQYYKEKGCLGVGEIMPNLATNDPRVQNLFRCAEKVGLPVTWDGSDRLGGDFGLYDLPGIPMFERTLARFPNLIVFAHGPIFWSEMCKLATPAQRKPIFTDDGSYVRYDIPMEAPFQGEGIVPKLFRTYHNLRGELSDAAKYIASSPKFGAAFLDEFQDRLFFGSDVCFPQMRFAAMELLLKWRDEKLISETVFRKIAHDNAARFFNI